MREILLSGNKVALVDDEDFATLSAVKWTAGPNSCGKFYAKRICRNAEGKATSIYMHRVILGLGEGEIADHKDRNGLNNQRSNLRRCNLSLNAASAFYPPSATGYRGVGRRKYGFYAQATVNRRTFTIGRFDNAIDAARARDAFVFKLYGEFAILNFPEDFVGLAG